MSPEEERRPADEAPRQQEPGAGGHTDDGNLAHSGAGAKSGTIVAQPLQVRCFLDDLFGGVATGEDGELERGKLPIWSATTKRTVWCGSLAAATEALVEGSNRGQSIYHSVALHDPDVALAESRRKKGNPNLPLEATRGCVNSAVVLGGLWSDEDHAGGKHERKRLPPDPDTVLGYLRSLPTELTPSLILDSGGGFYPWWFYREPRFLETDEDRRDAASLVERLQRYIREIHAPGFEHDSTWDLARVLRPPGVVNHKYRKLVRIVDDHRGCDGSQ